MPSCTYSYMVNHTKNHDNIRSRSNYLESIVQLEHNTPYTTCSDLTRLPQGFLVNRFDYDGDYGHGAKPFPDAGRDRLIRSPSTATGGQTAPSFPHPRFSQVFVESAVANPPKSGEKVRIYKTDDRKPQRSRSGEEGGAAVNRAKVSHLPNHCQGSDREPI